MRKALKARKAAAYPNVFCALFLGGHAAAVSRGPGAAVLQRSLLSILIGCRTDEMLIRIITKNLRDVRERLRVTTFVCSRIQYLQTEEKLRPL